MNNQLPWNFSLSGGDNEIGQSSKNEKSYDFPDPCVTKPNICLQTSRSLDTLTSELEDDLEDVFGVLADLQPSVTSLAQPSISIPSMLGICCQPDLDQSTEIVRKQSDLTKIPEDLKGEQSDERRKRTRSAEVHNLSERRRRDRINKKLKILQELVPNCNKSDRVSMLDDAIEHVKTLKHQVQIMQIFQAPYMSPTGIQTTQVPQFSQFVPIKPKFGMGFGFALGMVNMCSTAGLPMLPVPAAGLHPSLAAGVGLSLLSAPGNLPVPQMQMPFVHSQQLPASVDTYGMMPNFFPGFSPAFSFSGRVESGSQTIPSSATDQQLLPISQACCPSVSSSTMRM